MSAPSREPLGRSAAAPPLGDPDGDLFSGRTALVVDDQIADQDLHCLLLRRLGLRALVAADGWEALAYLRTVRPDVVVADLHMPRLDGLALLRRLRARPETAGIPLVLVSGDRSAMPALARLLGAAIVPKPVTPAALHVALGEAMRGAQQAHASVPQAQAAPTPSV